MIEERSKTVLKLKVNNHPGAMSHVCGLFARRAYNMEGILCLPMPDGVHSRIWLLLDENERLEQVIRQTLKLEDVIDVQQQQEVNHRVFENLEFLFSENVLQQ
jgi:acetolactate synthase-1/3 small subunit